MNEIKIDGKAKATRKRKTPASASTTGANPRKAAGPQKPRKSKTAGELQCQDISKGLSRTQAAPKIPGAKPAKTVSPAEITLLEQRSDAELLHDALLAFENQDEDSPIKQSRSSGLGHRHQAAYANFGKSGANIATPIDPNVPVQKDGSIAAGQRTDAETFGQHKLWDEDSDVIPSEFVPPPSAQGDFVLEPTKASPTGAPLENLETMGAAPGTLFNSDDMFSDLVEADELPMDDEGLEERMQSIVPYTEHNEPEDDWRPQDFSDDYMVADDFLTGNENSRDNPPHLPGALLHTRVVTKPEGNSTTSKKDFRKTRPSPFRNSQSSCILAHVSGNAGKPKSGSSQTLEGSENFFDDDDLDEGLIDLTADGSDAIMQASTPLTSPVKPSTPKLQWMPSKLYTPAKSSQIPASPTDVPHLVPFNVNGEALPFMRPPLPAPIRDRSPILGLTNRTVLRTCFRIGEAVNAAAAASRSNTDAVFELYARVLSSEREASGGFKQSFQFGDIFTDKPPYLSATYSLWKGVGLWDVDSRVFLGEGGRGKMARVVGRIKRCESGKGFEIVVLSVWEVDWEDVGAAKGIVCS